MERNYIIADYWEGDSGSLKTYMIHGSDVFHGTLEEAQNTLSYIKRVRPEDNWRIFYVEEQPVNGNQ